MTKLAIGMLATALTVGVGHASTNYFDFNSDPESVLTIVRVEEANATGLAGKWVPTGGSPDDPAAGTSTNGYLQLTAGTNPSPGAFGQRTVIVFPDFDPGTVIAGFEFSCDVRIGAGTTPPADGFSLNYAGADDPIVQDPANGAWSTNPGGEASGALVEEGCQNGLDITFDAWDSGSGDVIGMTIKVDPGLTPGAGIITNIAMPVLNGECTNINSLQTGTTNGGLEGLCWAPVYVNLTVDGKLTVAYKNQVLLTNFPVKFTPRPGRLVFGGRVGGSCQYQQVDNIKLVTYPSADPIVSSTTGHPNGFKFNIVDSGAAEPDTNTLTVTLDGASVTPTLVSKSYDTGNGVTTVAYINPSMVLEPGSTHSNVIHFTGSTFSGAVDQTNVFTIPNYVLLTSADKVPGTVNTSLTGYTGDISQIATNRWPAQGAISSLERQLNDKYIDPATGNPYVNIAAPSTYTSGSGGIPNYINWGQGVTVGDPDQGFFTSLNSGSLGVADTQIPGTSELNGSVDNVAAELVTILDLPVGTYTLGVQADDAFALTYGPEPRDQFAPRLMYRESNGNGTVNIVVTNAGMYAVRLVYGENTGGAGLEFYTVDFFTGEKTLINDPNGYPSLSSYRDTAALTQPYISRLDPVADQMVPANYGITVTFEDGSAGTVTDTSIKINGETPTIVNNGGETVATLSDTLPYGVNTATVVYSTSLGGPFTNSWSFNVFSDLMPVTVSSDTNNLRVYQPFGGSMPGNEVVEHAIDGFTQKYLNFGSNGVPIPPVGFSVTPAMGPTVVSGLRLFTANDAPERDPSYVVLQGSWDFNVADTNSVGTWHTIFSGPVTLPRGRNAGSDNPNTTNEVVHPIDPTHDYFAEYQFANDTAYTSYRWYTTTVRGGNNPNDVSLMQIGEVQILGIPGTLPPILTAEPDGSGNLTINANMEGTLQSRTDLSSGSWSDVGPVGPTSGAQTITPDPAVPMTFYRLKTP